MRDRYPRVRGVPAGHELAPGRAAERLHVVVLQLHALRRQPVQGGRLNLGAVIAHVPEALIVHQDEDDVRRRFAKVGAPSVRHDEAEEQTERKPPNQHFIFFFPLPPRLQSIL